MAAGPSFFRGGVPASIGRPLALVGNADHGQGSDAFIVPYPPVVTRSNLWRGALGCEGLPPPRVCVALAGPGGGGAGAPGRPALVSRGADQGGAARLDMGGWRGQAGEGARGRGRGEGGGARPPGSGQQERRPRRGGLARMVGGWSALPYRRYRPRRKRRSPARGKNGGYRSLVSRTSSSSWRGAGAPTSRRTFPTAPRPLPARSVKVSRALGGGSDPDPEGTFFRLASFLYGGAENGCGPGVVGTGGQGRQGRQRS